MDKVLVALCSLFVLLVPAYATDILSDNFNRANACTNELGNNWLFFYKGVSEACIENNQLRMNGDNDGGTLVYQNISQSKGVNISFEFRQETSQRYAVGFRIAGDGDGSTAGAIYSTDLKGYGWYARTDGTNTYVRDYTTAVGNFATTVTSGLWFNSRTIIYPNHAMDVYLWEKDTTVPDTPTFTIANREIASNGLDFILGCSGFSGTVCYFDNLRVRDMNDTDSNNYITTNKNNYTTGDLLNISYSLDTNGYIYRYLISGSQEELLTSISVSSGQHNITMLTVSPSNSINGTYSLQLYSNNYTLIALHNITINLSNPVYTPIPTPQLTYTPIIVFTPIIYNNNSNNSQFNQTDMGNYNDMGNMSNASLQNIHGIAGSASSVISNYDYSTSKSVWNYFIPSVFNIFPGKIWMVIILGWAMELILILLRR